MPQLSPPTEFVRAPFLAAMDELRAEGRGQPDDGTMLGWEMRGWSDRWAEPAGFRA
jgi:hypothetical protein